MLTYVPPEQRPAPPTYERPWLLLLLAFVWLWPGVFAHDLWQDEISVYAVIRQAAESGQWWLPQDGGTLFWDVPPLYMWLSLLFLKLFGHLPPYEAVRMVNALLAAVSLAAMGGAGRMLLGRRNGRTAVRAWEAVEKRTGLTNLVRLAKDREEDRFTYDKVIAQPRQTITAPTFTGSNQNRRYTPFTTNVEELVPFRTLTGRQHFYMDHEVMREFGEAQAVYRPILDFRPMNKSLNGTQKEITLKYLTPHNKWSTHSMYFDAQQMLTMFRGGQSVWMSEKDAAEIGVKDNDWIELYNRNGVVASRVVVSPRLPQGSVFMHHAQDRHINVPGSKISGTRAGTHNTPTHIHIKPTHLIGGYGQLSYGFNYYGPTGNQRDSYVVVRRMEEVDWLED